MNPCRTRRRLRKGLGDWGNLFDHAVNADFSEEFQVRPKAISFSSFLLIYSFSSYFLSICTKHAKISYPFVFFNLPSLSFQAHMESVKWRWVEPKGDVQVFGPLATWVERETAGCMVQHLLMGFELDLYEPKDYTMVYWWVRR